MIKHESKSAILFRHWLMANPMKFKCWFEMKDTRGKKNFNLKEWSQDQRDFAEGLKYSKKGVLVRTEGATGLPDYKYAYQEPTFIVINFNEGFVVIESETLALQTCKSIDFIKASELAHHVIKYKKK